MNQILLCPGEEFAPGEALIQGERARHMRQVLRIACQDRVRVGRMEGRCGWATVQPVNTAQFLLNLDELTQAPPPPLPLVCVLALPRPKVFRRILAFLTGAGVKEIHLLGSYRVEEAYWDSPLVSRQSCRSVCHLALEQARDTLFPVLFRHRTFKPFLQDVLPGLLQGREGLLLHPDPAVPPREKLPLGAHAPRALLTAFGPEGGWTPYEAESLVRSGLEPYSLGPRIFRVEEAIPLVIGSLWAEMTGH